MRHRELEASTIRALVKEDSVVETTLDVLNDRMNLIIQFLNRKLRDKRLSTSDFEGVKAVLEETLVHQLQAISVLHKDTEPTAARPNAQRHQGEYVGLVKCPPDHGLDTTYRLYSIRLNMTRKAATVELAHHPVAFQYHAVERLMERTMFRQKAISLLGINLGRMWPFIRMADETMSGEERRELHVPFGENEGMMIGDFIDRKRNPGILIDFRKGSFFHKNIPIEEFGGRMYVVRTFVSEAMLTNEQNISLSMVKDWVSKNSSEMISHNTFFSRNHPGGFHSLLPSGAVDACQKILSDNDFWTGIYPRKASVLTPQSPLQMKF